MPRLAYAETAQLFVGPKGGGQNHPCLCGSGKRIRGAACIEGAPGSPGQPPRPAMKQGVHKTSTFSSSSNPFSLTTLTFHPFVIGQLMTAHHDLSPAWSKLQ